MDFNNTIKVTKPIYLASGKSLEIKANPQTLAEISQIVFPYKGMQFYVNETDLWYKVDSLKNGYLVYATGQYSPTQPSGSQYVEWEMVSNLYINEYSPFGVGGSSLTFADTPSMETNVVFNSTFPSAVHGDTIVDVEKEKKFTKTTLGWFSVNIKMLPNDNIVPSILGTEVQPFK